MDVTLLSIWFLKVIRRRSKINKMCEMQFNISNDEQCCLHVNIFLRNLSLFHRRGPGSEACVCVCHVLHLQHAPRLLLLEHWDLVETCGNVHINKHDYEFGVTQFTRWLLTCVFLWPTAVWRPNIHGDSSISPSERSSWSCDVNTTTSRLGIIRLSVGYSECAAARVAWRCGDARL